MRATVAILLVNAVYALLGFLLYRGRVKTESTLLGSDLIVFLVPAVTATILNGGIMWRTLPNRLRTWVRVTLAVPCAFVLTFFAFWVYMVIGVNLYGE